jgi:hypothetical protein
MDMETQTETETETETEQPNESSRSVWRNVAGWQCAATARLGIAAAAEPGVAEAGARRTCLCLRASLFYSYFMKGCTEGCVRDEGGISTCVVVLCALADREALGPAAGIRCALRNLSLKLRCRPGLLGCATVLFVCL